MHITHSCQLHARISRYHSPSTLVQEACADRSILSIAITTLASYEVANDCINVKYECIQLTRHFSTQRTELKRNH